MREKEALGLILEDVELRVGMADDLAESLVRHTHTATPAQLFQIAYDNIDWNVVAVEKGKRSRERK